MGGQGIQAKASKESAPKGRGFASTPKGCNTKVGPAKAGSLQGDIFLEIPSRRGGTVAKYFGFTPMKLWESALNLANPKYLATSFQASRYCLEEIDIAG